MNLLAFPEITAIITLIFNLQFAQPISQIEYQSSAEYDYHIKFLTEFTQYPIKLVDHFEKSNATRWFKHMCQCFIEEIDNSPRYQFRFETSNKIKKTGSNLIIDRIEKESMFIIDHYEAISDFVGSESFDKNSDYTSENYDDGDEKRDIYTLIYLDSFEMIKTEIDHDEVELSCIANFKFPNNFLADQDWFINKLFLRKIEIELKFHFDSDSLLQLHSKDLLTKKTNETKKRWIRSTDQESFYEIELVEGPVSLSKSNFRNLSSSCQLTLKDYDNSIAYRSLLNKSIFSGTEYLKQEIANAGSNQFLNLFFLIIANSFYFITASMIF